VAVHLHVGLLSRPDLSDLRLADVDFDFDAGEIGQGHCLAGGRHDLAGLDVAARHDPREGGPQFRALQLDPGLLQGGLRRRGLGPGRLQLTLHGPDPAQIALRLAQNGLGLSHPGPGRVIVELDPFPLFFRDDLPRVELVVALPVRLRLRQHVPRVRQPRFGPGHVVGQSPAADLEDRRQLGGALLGPIQRGPGLLVGRLELAAVEFRQRLVLLHPLPLRDEHLHDPSPDLEGQVRKGCGLDRPRIGQAAFLRTLLAEPDDKPRTEQQQDKRTDDDLLLFQRNPPPLPTVMSVPFAVAVRPLLRFAGRLVFPCRSRPHAS